MRIRFICPRCAGSGWGTARATGPKEQYERNCNTSGCRFIWPIADDWRYFFEVYAFESADELREVTGGAFGL